MNKAGGIIGITAGVFAVFAALFTLFVGGVSTAMESEGSDVIVALGWGGFIAAFATIILGAVCIGTKSRIPGVLLIITSMTGAVVGGGLVAMLMAVSLIGGILALFVNKE